MSSWKPISSPDLMREIATRWRLTDNDCPTCKAGLYRHTTSPRTTYAYVRCPICKENFLTKDQRSSFDTSGDRALDEAAQRFTGIAFPVRHAETPRTKI